MKRAVCSRVPKFAAYFRQTIPEVREKSETGRPDPCFRLPRPVVMLGKIWLCSAVSDFSPHYRKTTVTASVGHGNATNTPRKQPLNAKTAFRRFPRTKPNVSSQGLITPNTLRENLQGRQSNTAKLSNQIMSPFMDQPFIKAIVPGRRSPTRPLPTRSPVNMQSDLIVNR